MEYPNEKPQSLFLSKFFRLEYGKKYADPRYNLEFPADSEAHAVERFYEEFFPKSQCKVYTVTRIR